MSCTYSGAEYSEGAVICQAGRLMRCTTGGWEDIGSDCEEIAHATSAPAPHQSAYRISESRTMVTTDPNRDIRDANQSILTPCLSFFSVTVGQVGIRNNCNQCKMAVVSWGPNNPHISRYKIDGYNQIVIKIEDLSGQLIGEDPC